MVQPSPSLLQQRPLHDSSERSLVQSKLTWRRTLGFQRAAHEPVGTGQRKAQEGDESKMDCTMQDGIDGISTDSPSANYRSSIALAIVATETKAVLPDVLASLPSAPATGKLYGSMHALHRQHNPHVPAATVRVLDADTIDAALSMSLQISPEMHIPGGQTFIAKPPLLLNMANAVHAGGGWLHGALAQEEALCYRSSLSFTLKKRFYPLLDREAIYSPTVVVVRDSLASGHKLLDLRTPFALPVVSVVSMAALRKPRLAHTLSGEERYAKESDRRIMVEKMKVVLRVAGMQGHTRLILGALGCGVFGNPRLEVARLWREVLSNAEWSGWFEEIVFAVLDGGNRNWELFNKELDGIVV